MIRAEILYIEGAQKLNGAPISAQQLVRATFSTNNKVYWSTALMSAKSKGAKIGNP